MYLERRRQMLGKEQSRGGIVQLQSAQDEFAASELLKL